MYVELGESAQALCIDLSEALRRMVNIFALFLSIFLPPKKALGIMRRTLFNYQLFFQPCFLLPLVR